MADMLTISVEPADLHAPASQAVLAGLKAFNLSRLPPDLSFGVFARSVETDALLAGITLSAYGDQGFTWWGLWTAPDAPAGTDAAVLAAADEQMRRSGLRRSVITVRAHAPRAALEMRGYSRAERVPDHLRGGDLEFYRKALTGTEAPSTPPSGISIQTCVPVTKPLAAESWQLTDRWRQEVVAEPYRWASAFLRDGDIVKGGVIGYAVADEFMVDMVWLDEGLRGTGTGARLIRAALEEARAMGCRRATVETADYQAPDFYRKAGFEDLAHVPDLFAGQGMNVLRRAL